MKIARLFGILSICLLSSISFANVIVTETESWSSVPITVDTNGNTYTVTGTVPTDTKNYYYSYQGYRCFQTQREIAGVNAVIFKASVSGGSQIYCYPE